MQSKVRQTGTSLRGGYSITANIVDRSTIFGYRSRDTAEIPHVVFQGPGSFRGRLNFFYTTSVAELRGVKVAQFSDFGLFSLSEVMRSTECPSSCIVDSVDDRTIYRRCCVYCSFSNCLQKKLNPIPDHVCAIVEAASPSQCSKRVKWDKDYRKCCWPS